MGWKGTKGTQLPHSHGERGMSLLPVPASLTLLGTPPG